MHLLAAKPGGFSDDEGIIDLQQSPADIIILSAQDSALTLLSHVINELPYDYPSIRLANVIHLNKPAAFDLYADRVLESASLIIVSLLGGKSYWQYGLEQLETLCAQGNIRLIVVSGDDQLDEELLASSNVSKTDALRCWHYLRQGGKRNIENLFAWLADTFFDRESPWQEPRQLPKAWIYHPTIDDASLSDWQQQWHDNHAVAVLLMYRSHVQSGNTHAFDDFLTILQQHQLNPLPIVISSLKHAPSMALVDVLCEQAQADIILNTTSFAVNNSNDDSTDNAPLFQADVPVIQLILAANSEADWREHPLGLRSRDLAMNIALPEMDGRIISRAISFKTLLQRDERTQTDVIAHQLHPERARFCAELAYRWASLRHKNNQQKRIALILANYPTHDGRIGNGVGFDTPASTMNILYALQQAGYPVDDLPENGNALIEALQHNITNDPSYFAQRGCQQSISLANYQHYFEQLPSESQQAVLQRWGEPQADIKVRSGRIMIAGIRLGETFVGVQPARGYNVDVNATYHDPDLIPPHNYLAFYFWLRHEYQVDAIAHIGKHGNLEWLPGKSVALSNQCWSDITLGAMPHLYPFIVNDPGEGTQAKRRAQAVIIDHLMPAMTRAENYGELAALEQLVDEYYQAMGLDKQRENLLREKVLAELARSKLDQELSSAQESKQEDERLNELDTYLCELKESQIRDGLHIMGESPRGEQGVDTLVALLRLSRGNRLQDKGILDALAEDLGIEFSLTSPAGESWQGKKPAVLQSISDSLWRTQGDTRERLELLAKDSIGKIVARIQAQNTGATLDDIPFYGASSHAVFSFVETTLAPLLDSCGKNEIQQFMRALSGKFVPAGSSGAPTRGRLDVLPTGRNFYSVDTRAIPTRTAYELGKKSADQLIMKHLQQHGEYPKTLGLSVWGTSTMRTGGDDIAQAFALMGVEPVWEPMSGRVIDIKVLAALQLNRPRVDVTLRISGFFRDAFPNVIRLFDSAVQVIADFADPADLNPLRDRIQQDMQLLQDNGLTKVQAREQAGFRVFGSKAGSYGAGLQGLIDERCWEDKSDLATAYVNWGGYAYGKQQTGKDAHAIFEHRLSQLDVVVQNQDNREHDLLDSDDYYQFQGGMTNAIRVLRGSTPEVYHGDHSNPASPKIRTLEEELNRVIRARVLNPKWIKGMQRHGYKGAFEMAATVDYLFAYDATTDLIKDYQYEKVTDSYLLEPENKEFLQQNNPQAMKEMAERLLEAMQRGLWQEPEEYRDKIEDIILALDEREEGISIKFNRA
ncbi:MAG: cobaltochelatase subunit CobN [Aquificaceae bacterium]|nr:MAG: cobaltochelatase subunit CobN [Aquificaceae bacterium]